MRQCLETKWGLIKHDVAKFIWNFKVVEAVQKSKTRTKDTIQKNSNFVNQSIHDNNILLFYIVGYCHVKFLTKSGQQHTQDHSFKAPTFYDLTKY